MQSTALLCVSWCLLTSFAQAASSQSVISEDVFHSRELTQHSESSPSMSAPGREEEYWSEQRSPEAEASCSIAEGIWRPGNTYNDPATLRTANATDCCLACLADDGRCLSWSRDTLTGACALKDEVSKPFADDRYESSGGKDIDESTIVRAIVRTVTQEDGREKTVAKDVEARGVAELDECFAQARTTYPRGYILRRTQTVSHEECCELCRRHSECFSWHRNARTRRCTLNRNVPSIVYREEHFAGGANV